MTIRRLLTTSLLFLVSLFLMAFQGEPEAPATTDMIPALIWILLLLVAAGLFLLAMGRRDVDAFAVAHHDDHGHDDHGHDAHGHSGAAHDAHADSLTEGHHVATPAEAATEVVEAEPPTVVTVVPPVMPMASGEPVVPIVVEVPDNDLAVAQASDIGATLNEAEEEEAFTDDGAPTLADDSPAIVPMSASFDDDSSAASVAATDSGSESDSADGTSNAEAAEPRKASSSIGMRERPNFQKVDIPDTNPSAKGAVRDTMEFRMGEDNPGEIVQRPATEDRPDPTPMSMGGGGLATADVEVPELDLPDLGMPALDAASSEPDTEAVSSIANVSLEAGLYEEAESDAGVSSGAPGWFLGSDTASTAAPTLMSTSLTDAEWDSTTLEPPNTAEGAADLPAIALPSFDPTMAGAPKWFAVGNDDADSHDDLQIIEGIGPKIASILNNSGIRSFRRLAGTSVERLQEILDEAGISRIADPSTWGEQARHAADGAMDKLQELQERLKGGRRE